MTGHLRRAAFVLLALGFAAAPSVLSLASCNHGAYDGSFDSSALEILAQSSGDAASGPPITQAVSASAAGETSVTTHDGVFEIDVPPHAFPRDVTITVTPLADRTIQNDFVVPSYGVTVTPAVDPMLPLQIQFRGNNTGSGGQSILAPVALGADGKTTSLLVVGGSTTTGSSGGPAAQFWAAVSTLGGAYSLDYVPNPSSQTFLQTPNGSCLSTCCNANHNGVGPGNAQVYATDVGCACANVPPNIECFVAHCRDLTLLANECVGLRAQPSGELGCGTNGQPCSAPGSVCCYPPQGGGGLQNFCSGPGNSCTYAAHCTNDAQCAGSGVCCAFDTETLCAPSCPPARRVCALGQDGGVCANGDSGTQCAKAGKCPFATCGATPAVCEQ